MKFIFEVKDLVTKKVQTEEVIAKSIEQAEGRIRKALSDRSTRTGTMEYVEGTLRSAGVKSLSVLGTPDKLPRNFAGKGGRVMQDFKVPRQ